MHLSDIAKKNTKKVKWHYEKSFTPIIRTMKISGNLQSKFYADIQNISCQVNAGSIRSRFRGMEWWTKKVASHGTTITNDTFTLNKEYIYVELNCKFSQMAPKHLTNLVDKRGSQNRHWQGQVSHIHFHYIKKWT